MNCLTALNKFQADYVRLINQKTHTQLIQMVEAVSTAANQAILLDFAVVNERIPTTVNRPVILVAVLVISSDSVRSRETPEGERYHMQYHPELLPQETNRASDRDLLGTQTCDCPSRHRMYVLNCVESFIDRRLEEIFWSSSAENYERQREIDM